MIEHWAHRVVWLFGYASNRLNVVADPKDSTPLRQGPDTDFFLSYFNRNSPVHFNVILPVSHRSFKRLDDWYFVHISCFPHTVCPDTSVPPL